MDLKTARRLKPGDQVVAGITDAGLRGYREGQILTVHSNDPCGPHKATRWLTFEGGRIGLSDYVVADHFDPAA